MRNQWNNHPGKTWEKTPMVTIYGKIRMETPDDVEEEMSLGSYGSGTIRSIYYPITKTLRPFPYSMFEPS